MEHNDTLTSLYGQERVKKDHPAICFRGMLDEVMADIAYGSALAYREQNDAVYTSLQDVNACLSAIMGVHVRGGALTLVPIHGRDLELLHTMSHDPVHYFGCGHFIPQPQDGCLLAWLNVIRTRIRCAERFAVASEQDATIVHALNRLSSAAYVLMCEEKARK